MLTEILRKFINDYPDFPKEGIIFKDICPILSNPELFSELIKSMSSRTVYDEADAIVAIDSRGFIFGSAISFYKKKPLILARKKNKLPGVLIQQEYGLEYGNDSLSIQLSSISNYKSFVIVDDLLATGGTANCIIDLLNSQSKTILGLNVVIELTALKGRNLVKCPIFSEIEFT